MHVEDTSDIHILTCTKYVWYK